IVPDTVFLVIGVIRVGGTELVLDLGIVLGFLVGVFDQQADTGTGGLALKNARKDFYDVVLATLGGVLGGAGFAAIQIQLQIGFTQLQPRRAAINDATKRQTMALAKGGYREQFAESIARHRNSVTKKRCAIITAWRTGC